MMSKKEIKKTVNAFSNEKGYTKEEYLSELLKLQSQMVEVAFGSSENLKLWDVLRKYNRLNQELGGIATTECDRLHDDISTVNNSISAEISGRAGERKAFSSLETLMCPNRIIKNVPLSLDDHRTELDAVVLTDNAIFVVEVKNTGRDVRIDQRGNYYRLGRGGETYDSNIGKKMNDKVYLLRTILKNAGITGIRVEPLVVFTNYQIHVQNDYPYLNYCYLSNLPRIIEKQNISKAYRRYDLDMAKKAILSAAGEDRFFAPVDVKEMVENFATLVAKVEAEQKPFIKIIIKIRLFCETYKKACKAAATVFAAGIY